MRLSKMGRNPYGRRRKLQISRIVRISSRRGWYCIGHCSEDELGDASGEGQSIVANSRILEYLPLKNVWISDWVTRMGRRDSIVDVAGLVLLLGAAVYF